MTLNFPDKLKPDALHGKIVDAADIDGTLSADQLGPNTVTSAKLSPGVRTLIDSKAAEGEIAAFESQLNAVRASVADNKNKIDAIETDKTDVWDRFTADDVSAGYAIWYSSSASDSDFISPVNDVNTSGAVFLWLRAPRGISPTQARVQHIRSNAVVATYPNAGNVWEDRSSSITDASPAYSYYRLESETSNSALQLTLANGDSLRFQIAARSHALQVDLDEINPDGAADGDGVIFNATDGHYDHVPVISRIAALEAGGGGTSLTHDQEAILANLAEDLRHDLTDSTVIFTALSTSAITSGNVVGQSWSANPSLTTSSAVHYALRVPQALVRDPRLTGGRMVFTPSGFEPDTFADFISLSGDATYAYFVPIDNATLSPVGNQTITAHWEESDLELDIKRKHLDANVTGHLVTPGEKAILDQLDADTVVTPARSTRVGVQWFAAPAPADVSGGTWANPGRMTSAQGAAHGPYSPVLRVPIANIDDPAITAGRINIPAFEPANTFLPAIFSAYYSEHQRDSSYVYYTPDGLDVEPLGSNVRSTAEFLENPAILNIPEKHLAAAVRTKLNASGGGSSSAGGTQPAIFNTAGSSRIIVPRAASSRNGGRSGTAIREMVKVTVPADTLQSVKSRFYIGCSFGLGYGESTAVGMDYKFQWRQGSGAWVDIGSWILNFFWQSNSDNAFFTLETALTPPADLNLTMTSEIRLVLRKTGGSNTSNIANSGTGWSMEGRSLTVIEFPPASGEKGDKGDPGADGTGSDATARQAAAAAQTTASAALPKAGGIMTGKITLDGAPTADLHAATKKYVDDNAGGSTLTAPVLLGSISWADNTSVQTLTLANNADMDNYTWLTIRGWMSNDESPRVSVFAQVKVSDIAVTSTPNASRLTAAIGNNGLPTYTVILGRNAAGTILYLVSAGGNSDTVDIEVYGGGIF